MFDAENISFDASLVIYINSNNIPPIMIINRIYSTQSPEAVACFLPGRAKDLSAPRYVGKWLLKSGLLSKRVIAGKLYLRDKSQRSFFDLPLCFRTVN